MLKFVVEASDYNKEALTQEKARYDGLTTLQWAIYTGPMSKDLTPSDFPYLKESGILEYAFADSGPRRERVTAALEALAQCGLVEVRVSRGEREYQPTASGRIEVERVNVKAAAQETAPAKPINLDLC
jgi:hypothetical protein